VHEPLISAEDFEQARTLMAAHGRDRTGRARERTRNPYVLRGLMYCDICRRRMQGQWSNQMPYYRCRYPDEYALASRVDHPRNVLLRENQILPILDEWLAQAFDPDHIGGTLDKLTEHQHLETPSAAMTTALGDMCAVLRDADPADKAEIYKGLKLRLTYHPEDNYVRAEIPLDPHTIGLRSVSESELNPYPMS
jgi:hypothetical protein